MGKETLYYLEPCTRRYEDTKILTCNAHSHKSPIQNVVATIDTYSSTRITQSKQLSQAAKVVAFKNLPKVVQGGVPPKTSVIGWVKLLAIYGGL